MGQQASHRAGRQLRLRRGIGTTEQQAHHGACMGYARTLGAERNKLLLKKREDPAESIALVQSSRLRGNLGE